MRLPNMTPFFWYASSPGSCALVAGMTWKAVSKNRVITSPTLLVACPKKATPSGTLPTATGGWLPSLSTITTVDLGRKSA